MAAIADHVKSRLPAAAHCLRDMMRDLAPVQVGAAGCCAVIGVGLVQARGMRPQRCGALVGGALVGGALGASAMASSALASCMLAPESTPIQANTPFTITIALAKGSLALQLEPPNMTWVATPATW